MYFVMFGIGVGFVVLSFLLGEFGDFGDIEGPSFLSFLKPSIIAIFLVVTGGLGLLIEPRVDLIFGGGIVLFISVLSGLFVAGLVNRFVLVPLRRSENTSSFHKQDTVGTMAEITSPIPQGGYGKIRYSVSGSYVTGPAKSDDGNAIPCGEKVEIIYIEKNTYFVRRQTGEVFTN